MISGKAKREILKLETYARFPYLIEITHILNNGTENKYYYANSDEDIVYNNQTYSASCFTIDQPEKKTDSISDAKLTISAIDQNWIQKIRETEKRAKIKFIATIIYEDNNVDSVEPIEVMEFELSDAKWNDVSITWTMEFDTLADINCPIDEINGFNTPALI